MINETDTIEVDTIEIDNKEYMVVKEQTYNNKRYVFLCNAENPKDFCIRKIVTDENNEEYIEKLESDKEFDDVFANFMIGKNQENS